MNKVYDLLIIGGGFSSGSFIYNFLKNGFDGKIAILEVGRKLGGRFSLKSSSKNLNWSVHHGCPNFNIINKSKNPLIDEYIDDLKLSKLINVDNFDLIQFNKDFLLSPLEENDFYKGNIYRAHYPITNLINEIISLNNKNDQVDVFLETLVDDLDFIGNIWRVSCTSGKIFECKYLVLSSNLLLHERSKAILNKNSSAFEKIIKNKNNQILKDLIKSVNNQQYQKRTNFIIYTNKSYKYKFNNNKKDIHVLFNNKAEEISGFERIIFQKQSNNTIAIVIHTRYMDNEKHYSDKYSNSFEVNNLLDRFNSVFENNNLINILNDYSDISIMRWRSSQPKGYGINKDLQICTELSIAFCGDWFDYEGFGRVEGAILSGLSLSNNLIKLI